MLKNITPALEDMFVQALTTEHDRVPVVEIDVFSRFADLYTYIPTNTKGRKDKNWSP